MNTLNLGRMSRPVTSLVAGAIVVLTVTACNGDTPPKPTDVPPPATTSTPASPSGSPSEPVETTTPANIKDAPLPEKIGEFTLGENLLTGIPEYQHPTDAATAVGFTGYDLPVSEFELQSRSRRTSARSSTLRAARPSAGSRTATRPATSRPTSTPSSA